MKRCVLLMAMVLGLSFSIAQAEVRMPAVFGDHMVLQRDAPVPVWGWADAGEQVTVSIEGQSVSAKAQPDGRWRVDLQPLPHGGPFVLSIKTSDDSLQINDVLVGDVWLCTGQSNMDFPLYKSDNAQAAMDQAADYPNVRLFKVERHVATEPQDDCGGQWMTNTPENARAITAVGYYFGQKLSDELDVPIGLIHSAYGGTPAEAWTSQEALEAEPALASILEGAEKKRADYADAMQQWRSDVEAAKASGSEPPAEPALPFSVRNRHMPTGLYNGMIHPLIPFGIRGVVWYQGESNTWRAHQYRTLLPVMIADWRSRWGVGDFPFGIVQIANYFDPRFPPINGSWPELREAQLMTAQSVPQTGLVVTTDVGNPTDIHPTDKKTVGDRLAQWALGTTYDKDVVPSGPMFREAEYKDGTFILHFDHAGTGLATSDGQPVRGVVIGEEPKKFRWATVEIQGDTLVVTSDRYKNPTSVRYGWADNPNWGNLTNKEGLPASPFRTDDWPGLTAPQE